MNHQYVLSFPEIDATLLHKVGGKGANLGEMSKIDGIKVPQGFCLTTDAYKRTLKHNKVFHTLLTKLSKLTMKEEKQIREISKKIRKVIETTEIPQNIVASITGYLSKFGERHAYAIRSSATAEDLPTASFAGQQDTYLNIFGRDAIIEHIKKCWASLFTDRAIIYRIQNNFDHHKVYLSVVVQMMIFPQASGILFTADPVTSNRKILSIDASFGLGEALVSGLVNADNYKVRSGNIIDKLISTKKLAIYPVEVGGTVEQELDLKLQNKQTLTDQQIIQLAEMGRDIEAYFGHPQDIEWCLSENTFYIVQSRPITTLYPIPVNDGQNRVYISLGHMQMMTEEIKPLGMSFIQMLSYWFGENLQPAGGRLFIDGTYDLSSPIGRNVFAKSLDKADVLIKNAIDNLVKRKEFMKSLPRGKGSVNIQTGVLSWISQAIKIYRKNDIAMIAEIIAHNEELIQDLERRIEKKTGNELLSFILQDTQDFQSVLTGRQNMGMMMIGAYISNWINKKMEKWLGEKNTVDILSKSVPNNITSEMGLSLMNVADVIRQYPAVMEYLHHPQDETFFADLAKLEGGEIASEAMNKFLEKYGMRCSGEIDITKPRWSEKPSILAPMILSNIKHFKPNASNMQFEQGRIEAEQKEQELLNRLQQLRGGKQKVKKATKMFSLLRNFIGFREFPKYSMVKRFQVYKKALKKEAVKLMQQSLIQNQEDIYYLSFEELRETIRTNKLDYSLITKRKEEYELYKKLTPPRVMTSEGEVISSQYQTGKIPQGALIGIPVSSGIIEGRARVILNLEDANIEEGDILVTTFTDPSWTPLFVTVKGLVTEVGGLMTHGAVITREYGLPGVVGVENATKQIQDGQRIRVNGTEGYIEIL